MEQIRHSCSCRLKAVVVEVLTRYRWNYLPSDHTGVDEPWRC